MDVSGTKERLGDVVTKVGQNIKEAQHPPEATSPHKSSKLAQIHAANETYQTSQGAMKAQIGTQIFSEQDRNVYKKKKCSGLSVSPSNVDISAAAAVQRRREP